MHPSLSHQENLQQSLSQGAERHDSATNRKGILGRWTRAVVRNWQRRNMIATLSAMDDRLLQDIGIYRGDIARVVDGFDDRELGMVPFAQAATPAETEYETFRKAA